VKIDRVIDVERGQQGENISLNGTHQQFEQRDTDHQDEAGKADHRTDPCRIGVQAVDHEPGEHLHEHVTSCHRDKQSQREAERADEEREELNEWDQPHQPNGRSVRHKKREEVKAVLPEPNDQHHREADDRQDRSDRQMARHREGMRAGNKANGHHTHEIADEDEHEQREHQRHIFLALWPHAGREHIADESRHAFNRGLPTPRDHFALHAAQHENPDRAEHEEHEKRAVGERDVIATEIKLRERLNLELMHRIDLAAFGCHCSKTPFMRKRPQSERQLYSQSARTIPDAPQKSL
jgi:hypothetical protein